MIALDDAILTLEFYRSRETRPTAPEATLLDEVGMADPQTRTDQPAVQTAGSETHKEPYGKCEGTSTSKRGHPGNGTSGGAAGGGTYLFDPVVEVVGSARQSQPRDTPQGVVAISSMYKGVNAPRGVGDVSSSSEKIRDTPTL